MVTNTVGSACEDCPVDLLCYDPPQKKPSFAKLRQVNLFAPRHRGILGLQS